MYLWMMIQVLIESLPISSSGHVMLLEKIYHALNLNWPYGGVESIQFIFHISAFFIILHYFFNQWSIMILGKKLEMLDFVKITSYQKVIKPLLFIFIVDVITFLFWKSNIAHGFYLQKYFLPIGFCITAMMLYSTKNIRSETLQNNFSCLNATILGIVQGLALLPGISRFASTFFASRVLGYNSKNSFAISFLIQFPLVCAAIVHGCIEMQYSSAIFFEIFNLPMLFAMVGMSFVSYKIFCFVGTMIEQNKIWYFSLYMIIPIIFAILL